MEARESSFKSIITNEIRLEIPFFQRHYTWEKNHWDKLYEDLRNSFINKTEHFLGSIILKRSSGNDNFSSVIDGQQRLTTFSILLKVLYDRLGDENKVHFNDCLFEAYKNDKSPKISHSKVDRENYRKLFRGEINQEETAGIFGCYNYFSKNTAQMSIEEVFQFMQFICGTKIWVEVCLNAEEDEQKIFDSINSTGEPLNASDIIKNALFDKAIKIGGEKWALECYSQYWEHIFERNEEEVKFWNSKTSNDSRTHSEILLHAFALINKIFNSQKHNFNELSKLYKNKIKDCNKEEMQSLLAEIKDYAHLYRQFPQIDIEDILMFEDFQKRLFHIMYITGIKVLVPIILYFNKNIKDEQLLKEMYGIIENIIIRYYITGTSTQGFNKLLSEMLNKSHDKKDIVTFINDKFNIPKDIDINNSLKYITINKKVTLILFWLELYRQYQEKDYKDKIGLQYVYTLEHLLPISWQKYWSKIAINDEKANSLIYQIGNMTLLKGKLNNSLKNSAWQQKLNGDGRAKNYISKNADLLITKELLNKKEWNEKEINKRTDHFINDFLKIWDIAVFTR